MEPKVLTTYAEFTTYQQFVNTPKGALTMARMSACVNAIDEFYRYLEDHGQTIDPLDHLAASMNLSRDELGKQIDQRCSDLDFLAELAHRSGAELKVTFTKKE